MIRRPTIAIGFLLAAIETLPAIYYGRYLIALDPAASSSSLVLSFFGTWAVYVLLIDCVARRLWTTRIVAVLLAVWTVLLQILYFGIYREFATLPTVSVIDFVRQTPDYAWALFIDRLNPTLVGVALVIIAAAAKVLRWGFQRPILAHRSVFVALGLLVLVSFRYTRLPFMSFGQQAVSLVVKSSHGPGVVNLAWEPDRVRPSGDPPQHPINIVVFRLEEIAAQATTIERPELLTTPKLKALIDEHPSQAFVGRRHYSNSTATDVSVLSIYTGLSPAADLELHRRVPTLWDYFSAAGYDTSMFIPFHLEWGDFKRRFNARPGELHLSKLLDAGNSGLPLVYDNSINDTDIVRTALEYQNKRGWAEPFLQIVSLKMPHAIGEGARVNKLDYGAWQGEPAELADYYNGIRHDDDLMQQYMAAMPPETREKTVFVILSDHGTRLFARSDGAEDLHRLDNYHQETTKVPFVMYLPDATQRVVPAEKVRALRDSLAHRSTSNIDVMPTLLGLAGIKQVDVSGASGSLLMGRDLSRPLGSTDAIIQLNSGPLRCWDREHFALVIDDGRYHYLFSMGRELLFDAPADPLEKKNVVEEPRYHEAVAKARAITAEVPELLRIQQKYRRRGNPPAEQVAQAATAAMPTNVLGTTSAPSGTIRLEQGGTGSMQSVSGHFIPFQGYDTTAVAEFVVRAHSGAGRLEWRLRSGAELIHVIHGDQLSEGQIHRFAFRWRPTAGNDSPLSVELFGASRPEGLVLGIEKATSHVEPIKILPPIEILNLSTDDGSVQSTATYRLDRFQQHKCMSGAEDCPNGYLVWGPYIKAAKDAGVNLRYDIRVSQPGLNVWLDLSKGVGQDRIGQSEIYRVEEPGFHTFQFNARLQDDAEALEGRLSASAEGSLQDRAVTVYGAELTLATRSVQ